MKKSLAIFGSVLQRRDDRNKGFWLIIGAFRRSVRENAPKPFPRISRPARSAFSHMGNPLAGPSAAELGSFGVVMSGIWCQYVASCRLEHLHGEAAHGRIGDKISSRTKFVSTVVVAALAVLWFVSAAGLGFSSIFDESSDLRVRVDGRYAAVQAGSSDSEVFGTYKISNCTGIDLKILKVVKSCGCQRVGLRVGEVVPAGTTRRFTFGYWGSDLVAANARLAVVTDSVEPTLREMLFRLDVYY